MRHGILVLVSLVAVAPTALAQRTAAREPIAARVTVLAESRDSTCWQVTQSPVNARLLACALGNDIRMLNTETHSTTLIVSDANGGEMAWSRAGDRLVWEGDDGRIWSVPLDPRTGARAGDARRISLGPGVAPAFSPDGKRVAFLGPDTNRKRAIIVMPANGGPETKVAEALSNGPLSWTPDGTAMFYASGAVDNLGRSRSDVYRVAADGRSKPVHVANLQDEIFRGMSPDGRFMVSGPHDDPTGWVLGTVTLRDSSGRPLGRATTPLGSGDVTDSGDDWTPRPLQIVARREWNETTLRTVDLATGESRELAHSGDNLADPRWSPDGRLVAARLVEGDRVSLVVMKPDGSGRRALGTLAVPFFDYGVIFASGSSWSPDSRMILYQSESRRVVQLHAIDVATNKDLVLAEGPFKVPAFHWLDNSRGARYMKVQGTGPTARWSIHEVGLDGTDRELRTLELTGAMQFVNADWILSARAGTIESVHGGAPRSIHTPDRGGFAAVSPDGRWLAFAPNGRGSASEPPQYDVVSFDGATTRSIKLPPGMSSTFPLFTADGQALLVPNANAGSNGRTPRTPAQILRVPVTGGTPRTAATLPAQERFSGGAVSPDGKTLLYVGDMPEQQRIFSLDLSDVLSASSSKKKKNR
jgi:Tol biopolymer transport system component